MTGATALNKLMQTETAKNNGYVVLDKDMYNAKWNNKFQDFIGKIK